MGRWEDEVRKMRKVRSEEDEEEDEVRKMRSDLILNINMF
jgi:hypothetical protein